MNATLETPAAQVVAAPSETAVAVIAPISIITAADIKPGCKKTLVAARIAGGASKSLALAEFDAALAAHREQNKAALAALVSQGAVSVRTLAKTKTGWRATLRNDAEAQAKAKAKAENHLASLEAKVAALKAKLATA